MSRNNEQRNDFEDLPPHITYWLTNESNHDCFFVVGPDQGQTERIGALKIFLIGRSVPLRNMLEESVIAERGDVRLPDINPVTFKHFLKCMYGCPILDLSMEDAVGLLYMVDKYLILDLKPKVVQFMASMLAKSLENVFIVLSSPFCQLCFEQEGLEKICLCTIQKHMERLLSEEEFLDISSNSLLWILQQEFLDVKEIVLWEAALKWAKHNTKDGENIRNTISIHLKYIRFCSMPCEYFCRKVIPENILEPNEVFEICKSFGTGIVQNLEFICNNIEPRQNTLVAECDFYYVINNIYEMEESKTSEIFNLKKFHWNILVKKTNNDFIGLFLNCEPSIEEENWSCQASADLVLVNQCGKENYTLHIEHLFSSEEQDWGFDEFFSMHRLTNPNEGFIKSNTIMVMVHLQV